MKTRRFTTNHIIPASVIMLLALAGCTGSSEENERGYIIPTSLCGMAIDSDRYQTVFPVGDEIEVLDFKTESGDGTTSPRATCTVAVDGTNAFSFSSTPSKTADDLDSFLLEENLGGDLEGTEQIVSGAYQIKASQQASAAYTACSSSRFEHSGMGFFAHVYWGGENRDHLVELIESYADLRMSQIAPDACDVS
ncbi:hypothetical protein [Streptomyces harbinensis]